MHAGKRTIRAPYATPLRHALAALTLLFTIGAQAHAQWELEESHSTASLRGIDNVGNGIAWASGTNGTVIRTEDGGYLWQPCTTPTDAEKLDFRGVQALDQNTAIVMSSGPGDQSRLYKTTDGCQSWTLLFTNPDKTGFWDALLYVEDFDTTFILGDPVNGAFRLFSQSGANAKFSATWNGRRLAAAPGHVQRQRRGLPGRPGGGAAGDGACRVVPGCCGVAGAEPVRMTARVDTLPGDHHEPKGMPHGASQPEE